MPERCVCECVCVGEGGYLQQVQAEWGACLQRTRQSKLMCCVFESLYKQHCNILWIEHWNDVASIKGQQAPQLGPRQVPSSAMPNIYEIIKFDVSSVALDTESTLVPPTPVTLLGVNDDFDVQLTDWLQLLIITTLTGPFTARLYKVLSRLRALLLSLSLSLCVPRCLVARPLFVLCTISCCCLTIAVNKYSTCMLDVSGSGTKGGRSKAYQLAPSSIMLHAALSPNTICRAIHTQLVINLNVPCSMLQLPNH